MVDFNTETAIKTPAKLIVGSLILEKNENFLNSKESYAKLLYQNTAPDISTIKARLTNLIDQWYGFLKRKNQPVEEWIATLEDNQTTYEQVKKIYYIIAILMDRSELTKIDVVKEDYTDIEASNERAGLD